MKDREKKTEKKLLRLTPTLQARLTRVAAVRGEDATEIIERGIVSELDRLEEQASVESQRMDKLRKLAAAQGGDVDEVLDRMLAEKTAPALPGMESLASEKLPPVEAETAA